MWTGPAHTESEMSVRLQVTGLKLYVLGNEQRKVEKVQLKCQLWTGPVHLGYRQQVPESLRFLGSYFLIQ